VEITLTRKKVTAADAPAVVGRSRGANRRRPTSTYSGSVSVSRPTISVIRSPAYPITTPPVIALTSRKHASPAGAVPARSAGTDSASTPSVSAAKSTATVAACGAGTHEHAVPVQNVATRPAVGIAATTVSTAPSAAVPTTGPRRPVTRSAISTSSAVPPAA